MSESSEMHDKKAGGKKENAVILNGEKMDKVNNILFQLLVIVFFAEMLFLSAVFSVKFAEWNEQVRMVIKLGNVSVGIVFLTVFALWGVTFLKLKKWKLSSYKGIIAIALMFVIHCLIRVTMIPTVQMDDGLVYYSFLNNIVNHPELLLDNFLEGGKLASHIAHGYVFLALIGEFIFPGTTWGMQIVQLFMGAGVACCLYGIFIKLFPTTKRWLLWICAFIVSVQPMFLGLSAMCNLEYALTIYFIYVLYTYLNKKYILTGFWLLMLGTTKEPGTMMAIGFVAALVLAKLIQYVRLHGLKKLLKKLDLKWGIILAVILVGIIILISKVLNMEVWGGMTFKDAISFGGEGNMTFRLDMEHLKMKLGQLYVLNFSWITAIIIIVGLIFLIIDRLFVDKNEVLNNYTNVDIVNKDNENNSQAIKYNCVENEVNNNNHRKGLAEFTDGKTSCKLPFEVLFILITCYMGYAFFLLFYQEAKQPRYNMLLDVLFLIFAIFMLLKIFENIKTLTTVLFVFGLLLFIEAFVTIDPVTTNMFTNINTNRLPMVTTLSFKSEKEIFNNNAGDFAYYNYQYTFVDRAINKIYSECTWANYNTMYSASDTVESQFMDDNIRWDTKLKIRGYDTGRYPNRFLYIIRKNIFEALNSGELVKAGVLIESPWCTSEFFDAAVAQLNSLYEVRGPYVADEGLCGTVVYYFFEERR